MSHQSNRSALVGVRTYARARERVEFRVTGQLNEKIWNQIWIPSGIGSGIRSCAKRFIGFGGKGSISEQG